MRGRTGRRAFTLIELLVVMTIMLILASLLLVGIAAAQKYVRRAKTKTEIDRMIMALTEYFNEFNDFPFYHNWAQTIRRLSPGWDGRRRQRDSRNPGLRDAPGSPRAPDRL